MTVSLTVVIPAFNEELHIARAIESVRALAQRMCVVDSFSDDRTAEIARSLGAEIRQRKFVNHADQFQWALDNFDIRTDWVMRLDADEYLRPTLARELEATLTALPAAVTGVVLPREVVFQGRILKHGGFRPQMLLRVWRPGKAKIEQRWMDEHIVLLGGRTVAARNYLVDENLRDLTWWIDKHNRYASREVVDILDRELGLGLADHARGDKGHRQSNAKRWLKENVYARLPILLRAFFYYLYRYFLRLGFLDGKPGAVYHFLQAFWYRFLVDAKLHEARRAYRAGGRAALERHFEQNLKLDIRSFAGRK